jgi:sigma-54 dependent transcriptional regulator, flagellar regulatory protein
MDNAGNELFQGMVGDSAAMKQVRRLMAQVANSDASVLILGESGTGKEVVASHLHKYSQRSPKPFVPINCGAIPADLLESELFGHEKGAFTGAICTRKGRFEMAEGGTLFMDEIGDMSLPMQVKLLRVLQERTFERIGSNKSMKANVRVVAATHRNLEDNIQEGRFREDLFYRLNVFPIELPPLRERGDDVPLLYQAFCQRFQEEEREIATLNQDALNSLMHYSWPGNVRELCNLVERLAILYPGETVGYYDLPQKYQIDVPGSSPPMPEPVEDIEPEIDVGFLAAVLPEEGLDLKSYVTDVEKAMINQALSKSSGVVAKAAKLLNMRRTTLVEKIKKYQISADSV